MDKIPDEIFERDLDYKRQSCFSSKTVRLACFIKANMKKEINPFVPSAPFLYPLKTSENLTVFWCFQEVEKGRIGNEWVKEISD